MCCCWCDWCWCVFFWCYCDERCVCDDVWCGMMLLVVVYWVVVVYWLCVYFIVCCDLLCVCLLDDLWFCCVFWVLWWSIWWVFLVWKRIVWIVCFILRLVCVVMVIVVCGCIISLWCCRWFCWWICIVWMLRWWWICGWWWVGWWVGWGEGRRDLRCSSRTFSRSWTSAERLRVWMCVIMLWIIWWGMCMWSLLRRRWWVEWWRNWEGGITTDDWSRRNFRRWRILGRVRVGSTRRICVCGGGIVILCIWNWLDEVCGSGCMDGIWEEGDVNDVRVSGVRGESARETTGRTTVELSLRGCWMMCDGWCLCFGMMLMMNEWMNEFVNLWFCDWLIWM